MLTDQAPPLTPAEQRRSWLAALLLRKDNPILPRFMATWDRLARRPRSWRRRFTRGLAITVTGAALLLAVAGFGAHAEGDNVITVVNGEVKIANNGKCSLIEAIRNANNQNTGQPHNDCAAGNPTGADTIVLPVNGVFTLTERNNDGEYGPNGLPWIGSTITIEGNGSTVRRSDSAQTFRILAVGPRGNLTLTNTVITGGYMDGGVADYYAGGGILNQGTLHLESSTIENNIVEGYDSGASGGGIYSIGTLVVENSNIIGNKSWGHYQSGGGGISSSKTLEIKNSQISGNEASARLGIGAGIEISGTSLIEDSIIENNEALGYFGIGGGIQNAGTTTISKSLIRNNFASGSIGRDGFGPYYGLGGGIDNIGNITIVNITLTENSIEYGFGGGFHNRGDATITNSTIIGNDDDGVSGGCFSNYTIASITYLERTIISGNSRNEVVTYPYQQYGYHCIPQVYGNAHNIIGANGNANSIGFTPGPTDIIPSAPLNAIIGPLADNGGPTWTHALPPGSPAIDRAPNNSCTATPVNGVDQRGFPRNRNGAGGSSTTECDIGAFEFQPVVPTATPTHTAVPTNTATPTATATTPAVASQTPPPLPSATATLNPYPFPSPTPEFDWSSFIPILMNSLGPIR